MIGIPDIGAKARDAASPVPQLKYKVERTVPRMPKPTVKLPISLKRGRESPFLDVVQRSRAPAGGAGGDLTSGRDLMAIKTPESSSSPDPGTQNIRRESASAEEKTRAHARLRVKAATALSTAKSKSNM